MKANRRSILAMIGMAPAAATLDAGTTIRSLSGDVGGFPPYLGSTGPDQATSGATSERSAWLKAIMDPDRTHALRMLAKDQVGTVTMLDPDIAAKRSWSMAVKVAEQRKRYIDRRIANEVEESSWVKMRKIVGL